MIGSGEFEDVASLKISMNVDCKILSNQKYTELCSFQFGLVLASQLLMSRMELPHTIMFWPFFLHERCWI